MPRRAPDLTPEARENRMIDLAYRQAERQLEEGTASPLVLVNFLKLGSERSRLETERLRAETDMLKAKKQYLESSERTEELYQNAIDAMKRYGRSGGEDD